MDKIIGDDLNTLSGLKDLEPGSFDNCPTQ
jgi:hypothetical protein